MIGLHQNMTTPAVRIAIGAALVLLTITCGSNPTSSTALTNTFHTEVADPAGDAVATQGFPNTPDLVHAVVDVAGTTITFSIQFVPGTLDPGTTRVGIPLDTDRVSSTGINAWGIGVDYLVDIWAPSNQAIIARAVPSGTGTLDNPYYVTIGTASLSLAGDNMMVTVPLSLLGNANGRLNYRMFTYSSQPSTSSVIADVMPDTNIAAAHVP